MKTVAFFNNKGGVGKTTLVCNVASYLAAHRDKKILIFDLDPQCNTTQLVLDADKCACLYWPEESFGDPGGAQYQTIYDALRPLEEGDALPARVTVVPPPDTRFGISVIPGHPRMSIIEDLLGQWFREAVSGEIAGIRKTLWLKALLGQYSDEYDLVFFDLGPSLGALNRSVLAASDYFLTPMGADIFSVVAIRNIGDWITRWARLFGQGVDLCMQNNPESAKRFNIHSTLPITHGYIGYTVQQYSTVTIRGERRATLAFENIISRIPDQVSNHMSALTANHLCEEALKLGDIPNLRSLVPLAQSVNAPLAALSAKDGLAGGQYSQQRTYVEFIGAVAEALDRNLGGLTQ